MPTNYYETDRGLSEYLLFHYGVAGKGLSPLTSAFQQGNFPERCVTESLSVRSLPKKARALELGCAVGRASFELAKHCEEVVGIDFSERFISVANHLRKHGSFRFNCVEEGELFQRGKAVVPTKIKRQRVRFETGDATQLRPDLGTFDVILMANLIDRLPNPRQCLRQLPGLLNPGGQLIITSPYTWLLEYTPRKNWLGGFTRADKAIKTLDTLKEILDPDFRLRQRRDLPFLIREHARKFQLGIAEATVWVRK